MKKYNKVIIDPCNHFKRLKLYYHRSSKLKKRMQDSINLEELARQVELVHAHNLKYNIVMNGSCFGGLEFSLGFREKINNFIEFIDDINVDNVTVMNPFLIDLIRNKSKDIEITVSSFAEIVDPVRIKRCKKRGANRVVLHQNVYRNVDMLRKIRESTDLKLEIIPNQGCLNQCECFITHINIVAHASVAKTENIQSFGDIDYPIKQCRIIRQTDPIEFLMSCFIRPEDLYIYEEIGIDIFKLAGRRSSTEWMLNVLKAYVLRNYEGNVFDLSSHIGENDKLVNLPNKELNGWYQHSGSNADSDLFRDRAVSFCRQKGLYEYF
jgi:collagenase-like PrtC family protease